MTQAKPSRGRIVIAGGSGYLGRSLARHLAGKGWAVTILSRSAPRTRHAGEPTEAPPWDHATWDGRTLGDWSDVLDGASALINLAGRSVDCVKTPDHCDEILRSRVESTRALGEALRTVQRPPPVWVQMSTAHIYGDSELTLDESAAFGYGLAPTVGMAWEEAHLDALLPDMRSVMLRTSFVLGTKGGALPRLASLAKFYLGGTVGSGRQGMSWIHERDMNRVFERAITNRDMHGAYIASAPNPVSNAEFMRTLRKALGRPFGLPSADWMVRLGAPLVMRSDPELALYGRYVIPKRLLDEGFEFDFPRLGAALEDLYTRTCNRKDSPPRAAEGR